MRNFSSNLATISSSKKSPFHVIKRGGVFPYRCFGLPVPQSRLDSHFRDVTEKKIGKDKYVDISKQFCINYFNLSRQNRTMKCR